MAQCMCKIMLDVAERDNLQTVIARQGDSASRFLRLRLLSYGEPLRVEESATAILNVRNAAGELRAFAGDVHSDGSLTLPIGSWMLKTAGTLQCDVSIFDAAGGRLTTPPFEIEVMPSVSGEDVLPGDSDGDGSITARFFAEEKLHTLEPTLTAEGFLLSPLCNRKYALDLSGKAYADDKGWLPVTLELPTPTDTDEDSWVLIYCHAPLRDGQPVSIDWGFSSSILFTNGTVPQIGFGDFDVICTYSAVAGKWQIGVVQYEAIGGVA